MAPTDNEQNRGPLVLARAAPRQVPTGLPPRVMLAVGLTALVSLVLEYGFRTNAGFESWLHRVDIVLAVAFGIDLVTLLVRAPRRLALLRQRWYEYAMVLLFLVSLGVLRWLGPGAVMTALLATVRVSSVTKLYIALTQLFVVVNIGVRFLRAQQNLLDLNIRSELLFAASFAMLILGGTLLLLLPRAMAPGAPPISLVDSFFTATSAVCVTGLVVRDTGSEFSSFGQLLIMLLFQVGGMGIITFVALVPIISGKRFTMPGMVALRDMVNVRAVSEVKHQVLIIVIFTAFVEALGALGLYASRVFPTDMSAFETVKWCVFHAISAFCNAGFSLQRDSLVAYRTNPGINLTMIALIVVGGLGFPAVRNLLSYRPTTQPFWRRLHWFRRLHHGESPTRLQVQTRLVVWVTVILIAVGTVGFWLLERGNSLAGEGGGGAWIALFQSVTPRTAGFNTTAIDALQDSTLILLMVLMVIGASPASTGGGIKTTTFGVLLLTLRSRMRGSEEIEIWGRSLPRRIAQAAISVFVIYVMVATISTFLLAITDPPMAMQDQAFEVISALSTVGLSTGITAKLSTAGKLVLCVCMYVGRIGPLTLAMSVWRGGRHTSQYHYPEEPVIVG